MPPDPAEPEAEPAPLEPPPPPDDPPPPAEPSEPSPDEATVEDAAAELSPELLPPNDSGFGLDGTTATCRGRACRLTQKLLAGTDIECEANSIRLTGNGLLDLYGLAQILCFGVGAGCAAKACSDKTLVTFGHGVEREQ